MYYPGLDDEDDLGEGEAKFYCRRCKYENVVEWRGPCPSCRGWYDCLKRKRITAMRSSLASNEDFRPPPRIPTGIAEFDRVLGANTGPDGLPDGPEGLMRAGVILLGGPKGKGKTTLTLQVADGFARDGRVALVASHEMNKEAVRTYCWRLGIKNPNVHVLGKEGNAYKIKEAAEERGAKLVVVDALQTAFCDDVKGDVGSQVQVNAVVNVLTDWANNKRKVAVIIICHLTKSGGFAGTETAAHLVDVLMSFREYVDPDETNERILSGEQDSPLREIAIAEGKNRGGASDVTSIMEMTATGLKSVQRSKVIKFPVR